MKPISPNEITEKQLLIVPEQLIITINRLLILNFKSDKAIIWKSDIINDLGDVKLFDEKSFDIIDIIYENAGWHINVDYLHNDVKYTFTK